MHHEWPQFTTTIKQSSRVHHILVLVFHMIPCGASVGGLHTIPMSFMKYSGVSSNSTTVEAIKFAGPHKSRMHQYINNLVHRGQMIDLQSTQPGATTFRAPNMKAFHSPSFPSDILQFPLVVPSCLT
jgi:hypothetical protein